MSNTSVAVGFLRMAAADEVVQAFERHVAPAVVHHNPHFAHDRQSLLQAMADSAAAEPDTSFEVLHTIEQDDTGAVHSRLTRAGTGAGSGPGAVAGTGGQYAVVHPVRFSAGRIVELWDIAQPVPASSPNALGMF